MKRGFVRKLARLVLPSSRAGVFALLAPFALYLLLSSLLGSWIVDDAGIVYAYARNIAHGAGFVSQPGRSPVEGYSDPLWVLILVPFFLLRLFHPVIVPKVLGALLVLGSFRALQYALGHATGRAAPGFFAAVLLSASPPLTIWCTSGLENALVLFLVSVFYALAVVRPARWCFASGVVTGLLAMTRPEAITLAAAGLAIVLGHGLAHHVTARQALNASRSYLGGLAYVVVPFFLLRFAIFGRFLPHTYYAKREFFAGERLRFFLHKPNELVAKARAFTDALAGPAGPWVLGLIALAVFLLVARRKLHASVGAAAAIMLVALLTFVWVEDDWMGELRFGTAVVASTWLTAVAATAAVVHELLGGRGWRALGALCALACLGVLGRGVPRILEFAAAPTLPYEDVDRQYARKFDDYARALDVHDGSVLLPDCGATLVSSHLRVLDLAGLFEPDVVRTLRRGSHWLHGSPEFSDWVLETARPTFIATHGFWSYFAGLDQDPRFARDYVAVNAYPDSAVEEITKTKLRSGTFVRRDALREPGDIERLRGSYRPYPRPEPLVTRLRMMLGLEPAGGEATDEQLRAAAKSARELNPNRAASLLARLVARHPDDVEANVTLGEALDRSDRADEARAAWSHALELAQGKGDEAHAQLAEQRLVGAPPSP